MPLELGLLLDSSGSVTVEDFGARNAALGQALRNPWLRPAIESSGRALALGVYQYSGPGQVEETLPWTLVDGQHSAAAAAAGIESMTRLFAGGGDLDSALLISSILTESNGFEGVRQKFIVLADGPDSSTGLGRDLALARGIDEIAAWVTADPADLAGYTGSVTAGGGGALAVTDPAAYEELFLKLLFEYFQNPDNTAAGAAAALGQGVLEGSRFAFSDLNQHLVRLRSGIEDPGGPPRLVKWPMGSAAQPVLEPAEPLVRWSTFGTLSAGRQHGSASRTSVVGIPVLTQAAHTLRYTAATAGIEAQFRDHWTLGSALIGYHGDIDMDEVGDADDDALGGALYLSHQRALPWWKATVYGDVMAGWLGHDIDFKRRVSGGTAKGSPDADTRVLELNLGARMPTWGILHGPEIGLSSLRGGIDGFREHGAATAEHGDIDFKSLLLRMGYHGSVRVDFGNLPVIFNAGTGWEHEFEDSRLGPDSIDIAAAARDTWVLSLGAQVPLNDFVSLRTAFESRLARATDSQFVNFGCEVSF